MFRRYRSLCRNLILPCLDRLVTHCFFFCSEGRVIINDYFDGTVLCLISYVQVHDFEDDLLDESRFYIDELSMRDRYAVSKEGYSGCRVQLLRLSDPATGLRGP